MNIVDLISVSIGWTSGVKCLAERLFYSVQRLLLEVFVFARPNLFIFLALYCNHLGLSDVLLGLSICLHYPWILDL